MEFLSPESFGFLAQAAPAPVSPVTREMLQDLLHQLQSSFSSSAVSGKLLLWMLVGPVISILAFWLASKPMAGERGTMGKALKTYLLFILVAVVWIVLMVVGLRRMPGVLTGQPPGGGYLGFGIALVIMAVISLWALFAIPMRVYRLGFAAALGLLILQFVLRTAGQYGTYVLLGRPLDGTLAIVQRWQQKYHLPITPYLPVGRLAGAPVSEEGAYAAAERDAADPAKSLLDRQGALKDLYARLETMRTTLQPGDTAGLAEYERRRSRYEQLLNQLRKEAARQRGNEI